MDRKFSKSFRFVLSHVIDPLDFQRQSPFDFQRQSRKPELQVFTDCSFRITETAWIASLKKGKPESKRQSCLSCRRAPHELIGRGGGVFFGAGVSVFSSKCRGVASGALGAVTPTVKPACGTGPTDTVPYRYRSVPSTDHRPSRGALPFQR